MSEAETGAALLALSPDEVFTSRSIAEVVELHKRIQSEIERKREELRAMVGERYRDLIHAADTIEEMKGSAARAVEHVGQTVALCRNLHDTHLIGFRIPEKTSYIERNKSKSGAYSVAVQVKLLLDIPEQIWMCLEREDFLTATQLYILARHIHTGLQVQANSASVRAAAERRWHSVSALRSVLQQYVGDKLQELELTDDMACSCLLSLYLLDAKSSLLELLDELISLHSNRSLETTLQLDLATHAGPAGSFKDEVRGRIVSSVKIVMRTIELVQKCFVERAGGRTVPGLLELCRRDAAPLLDLVQRRDDLAFELLPPVITSYRLTATKPIEPLSKQEVSDSMASWIAWVQSFIQEKVKLLLQNITSAKTLHRIREEALKIETPADWADICASLSMQHIDVWSQFFQPLLTARVKEIIDAKWRGVLETFQAQIVGDLVRATREESEERECDLNWFVWRDLIGDTVIESRDQVVDVMNTLMKGMWLQDRGFTPTLERTCLAMDSQLGRLLLELSHYLQPAGGAHAHADRADVQGHLRDVSGASLESMLEYIKEDCFRNPELQSTELQRKTTAIYAARFIQALSHLMPNLRSCYVPAQPDYLDYYEEKEDEGVKLWSDMCARLKESCLYCWGKWVDIAMQRVQLLTAGLPQEFTIEANLDYLLMQWDVIKIEEKDEEEKTVESTIKIPAGPSLKLQEYIHAVGRILDEVIPHTLPREIHADFIKRVVDVTLAHYGHVVREKETDINQKCALQLLMDVRHFTVLLVARENESASEAAHAICESLRKIIDPFDYDVFYPYIQTNVKRSVQRVLTLLGSVVSDTAAAAAAAAGPAAGVAAAAGGGAPALLAMPAEPAPWFSLLPVTAPAAVQRKPDKTRKKGGAGGAAGASPARAARAELTELVTSSLPLHLASAKSGAAAFFGSMTSDWFSSS